MGGLQRQVLDDRGGPCADQHPQSAWLPHLHPTPEEQPCSQPPNDLSVSNISQQLTRPSGWGSLWPRSCRGVECRTAPEA